MPRSAPVSQPSPPTPASRIAGEETRARLIQAATEVFLADGFRAARVQDIAARAGLRLSAINYHFASKEGLYLAVLQHHAALALEQAPLQAPDPALPVEARFRFAVQALITRLLDERSPSRIARLMLRELVNPTAALEQMIERFSLPQARLMRALLREAVGPAVPELAISRALVSVFGQCVVYIFGQPMVRRIAPEVLDDPDRLTHLAQHVADFSWAGLQALRRRWESSPESVPEPKHDTP